jgi:hypothetical protein
MKLAEFRRSSSATPADVGEPTQSVRQSCLPARSALYLGVIRVRCLLRWLTEHRNATARSMQHSAVGFALFNRFFCVFSSLARSAEGHKKHVVSREKGQYRLSEREMMWKGSAADVEKRDIESRLGPDAGTLTQNTNN